MTPEERALLIRIARDAVTAVARGASPAAHTDLPDTLREKGAAFVTLRVDGELRGCIGHIHAHESLWRSVQQMASAAAERDNRFTPVRLEELARLSVDISVLSPMRPARPADIVVRTHGLYIRLGKASGLLLPQVAVEWGWDGPTFLRETCRKAGLPPDAFLDPQAELYTFTAEVFGDGASTN